ncbi:MAG: stage III sporulation protein AC [Chloroflexota bacterium]
MAGVELVFKIAGVGIIISVIHTVLKQAGKDEQAYFATLAGVAVVLYWVVQVISDLFRTVRTLFQL